MNQAPAEPGAKYRKAQIILHLEIEKQTQPLSDSSGIYDHRKKKSKEKLLQCLKILVLFSPSFTCCLSCLLLPSLQDSPHKKFFWLQHCCR